MSEINVYTDGSCIGNPGPGGWGVVMKYEGREMEMSGGDASTTNNRMEMTALLEALRYLNGKNVNNLVIHVWSDSSIVIKTFTEGWKKKSNTDLWGLIEKEYAELFARGNGFKWHWVKGHAGHAENERCDQLALAAAMKFKRG